MADENKCAHELCSCARKEDSAYCSQHCEDAETDDMIEIRCDCGHAGCA